MNKPLEKHATHQVEIRNVRNTSHYGQYWCKECDQHVTWISKEDWKKAQELGLVVFIKPLPTWGEQRKKRLLDAEDLGL